MNSISTQASHTSNVDTKKQTYWQGQITLFKTSGLNRKAFCRREQLNYDQFQYWYQKLGCLTPKSPSLIPVKLKFDKPIQTTLCTLELSQGHRLLIHDQVSLTFILEKLS